MKRDAWRTVWLVATLVLLSVATAQPGTSTRTEDLEIVRFGYWENQGPPQWTDGVGGATRLRVDVKNDGTVPVSYELHYFWNSTAGRMPLNGAPETSFDVQSDPVPKGTTTTHWFDWRLQPGQEGAGRVEVEVSLANVNGGVGERVAERDYADNAAVMDNLFVTTRSFAFATETEPVQIEADATGFIRLNLTNAGNAPVDVHLRITQQPADLRLNAEFEPADATIPARSNRTVALLVHFDPAGDFTPFAVQYRLEADPGFGASRALTTPTLSMAQPGALDRYEFAVGVGPGGEILAPTTQTTRLPIWIANRGIRPDVYTMDATAPDGWTATMDPARVPLKPGETTTALLNLRPALSAAPGSLGQVRVQAKSSILDDAELAQVPVRVSGAAPTLRQAMFESPPYVGQPASVLVTVANPGDRAVPSGTVVGLTVDSPGAARSWLNSTVSQSLAAGDETDVRFTLPPALAGGILHVDADWFGTGSSPDKVSAEALVHAVALRLRAPPPQAGAPGETLAYRNGTKAFQLVNVGNAAETVMLEVSAASGTAVLEGAIQIGLQPGQTVTIPIRQRLPDPAGSAERSNLTLTATVAGTTVTNTTQSRIADAQPPALQPGALPRRWNAGDVPLGLELRITDHGAVRHANATVVAPGGTTAVVPMLPGPDGVYRGDAVLRERGNHTVRFAAVDTAGNRALSPPQVVEATLLAPPMLRLNGVPANGNLSARNLTVVVDSELAVLSIVAELRQGGLAYAQEASVTDGRATLNLTALKPGPLELSLTARDVSGAVGTFQTNLTLLAPPPTPAQEGPPSRDAGLPGLTAALAICAAAAFALMRKKSF